MRRASRGVATAHTLPFRRLTSHWTALRPWATIPHDVSFGPIRVKPSFNRRLSRLSGSSTPSLGDHRESSLPQPSASARSRERVRVARAGMTSFSLSATACATANLSFARPPARLALTQTRRMVMVVSAGAGNIASRSCAGTQIRRCWPSGYAETQVLAMSVRTILCLSLFAERAIVNSLVSHQ